MKVKFKIEEYEELDSTNKFLLEKANTEEFHGKVICANSQRKARGRHGRVWETGEKGTNLAMSMGFILAKSEYKFSPHIPILVAIACYNTVASYLKEEAKKKLSLKWPNDLIWDTKKLMGILTQAKEGKEYKWICVGLGLNIKWSPETMSAISLSKLPLKTNLCPKKEEIMYQIVSKVEEYCLNWKNFPAIKKNWEECAKYMKKTIYYKSPLNKTYKKAKAICLDSSGGLLVQKENGEKIILNTDEISLRLSDRN